MFAKIALLCALACVAKAGVLAGYGAPALGYAAPVAAVRATPVYRQAPALAYAAAAPQLLAAPVAAAPVVAKAIVAEPAQPYEFGYSHHTDDGAASSRSESSDGGNAKHGSYSIQNPDGTYRHVEYVADAAGFRAIVKTNEHGTAPQNPAATQLLAEEPPYKVLNAPAPVIAKVATPVIAKAAIAAPVYAHGGYIH